VRAIWGAGGLPPATALVRALYPGVYPGRGPPLPTGAARGAGSGGQVAPRVDPSPLPATFRDYWRFRSGVGEGSLRWHGGFGVDRMARSSNGPDTQLGYCSCGTRFRNGHRSAGRRYVLTWENVVGA
jgi:hypothetical protein